MLFPILALALLQADATCNDTTRKKDESSGTTTNGQVTCPSITIAGQTLQGPTCYTDKKFRRDTLFKCEGRLKDVHCKPKGGKSTVIFYNIADPCPTVPTSLSELKRLAKHGFNCKPPKEFDRTFDWSATVCGCANGTVISFYDPGETELIDDHIVVYTDHFPDDILTGPYENPNLTLLEGLSTITPQELGSGVLLAAWEAHPPLTAARLSADVAYSFSADPVDPQSIDVPTGSSSSSYTHTLDGIVSASGFSLTSTTTAVESSTGTVYSIVDDLAFDGVSFFVGTQGNNRYHAYADGPVRWNAMDSQAFYLESLIQWVENPFDVSLLAGARYVESPVYTVGSDRYVDVTVSNSSGISGVGDVVYSINVGTGYHVSTKQVYDPAGNLLRRSVYSAYSDVAPGKSRPTHVVEEVFTPGQGVPTATITLDVATGAAEIPLPSPMPVAKPVTDWWAVHLNL